MKHKPAVAIGALLSAIGLVAASAVPALAQPIVHEHFANSGSVIEQEVFPEFCGGTVDFPVLHTWEETGRFHLVLHGDGLPYFVGHLNRTDTYTNTENGKTLTVTTVTTEKDKRVIDNGDGTFTVVFNAAGNMKSYGPDGTRLFMDTGIFTAEVLFDNGGTPTDPTDDEFIEFVDVIARHGLADTFDRDFCEDIVTFIG